MKLTVATWNVLADCYAHGQRRACAEDDASKKKEAPGATNWSNRKLLLEHSLKECTADLICLQEVDHFADFYQACLTNLGYRSLYMQRPERKDGCVIAYKTEFLALTSVDRVNMNDAIVADSLYEYQKYQKNNVALSVKLEHIPSGKKFIVCTCHIHWNPCLPEVKSSQVLYLLQRLNAFCDNEDIPVILTGDFNTLPEDAIYEAIIGPSNMTVLQQRLHQLKYGGDLYGPKTRFLCDASLNKLCKWLRVLGVNVALDAWDNGVPASSSKHKNKAKWQWSSCTATTSTNTTTHTNATDAVNTQEGSTLPTTTETSSEPPQPPAELSYAARVSSINAFFTRAEREKRVILTTSKTLRERASCPRNFYVNPQNLETGLIDICAQFGLALSRDRFLTVCGKCGDEVEEVNRNDPRLQDKYLPSDRTVFACVNCAQPYWWNEKAGSLPAKAMEKAEQLFQLITEGLEQRAIASAGTGVGVSAVVQEGEKPRVRAGTCILKDFGRTAKNPSLKNLSVSTAGSDSKSAELQLEMERLRVQEEGTEANAVSDTLKEEEEEGLQGEAAVVETGEEVLEDVPDCVEELLDVFPSSGTPCAEAETENGSQPSPTTDSAVVTPTIPSNVEDQCTSSEPEQRQSGGMSMEELSRMFENRKRSILQGHSSTSSEPTAGAIESTDNANNMTIKAEEGAPVALELSSVFSAEDSVTNWNGGFSGTLDYVFVSRHWSVQQPTTVLPKVDLHGSVPTIPAAVLTSLSSKREAVMVSMPAAAAVEGEQLPVVAGALLQQVLTAPQPTLHWPSDHFIVYASLKLA